MLRRTRWTLLAFALLAATATHPALADLSTLAEQTGFKRTGRYEEVERLCQAFAEKWPAAVRCFEFGRSPEGRPMLALAASRAGALTAEAARERKIPVLLFQGGIHSGEIDGKDAGFLVLRELLEGRAAPGALDKVVFVFVPVFSVDAHERFGRWNRPNQNGPEEMGWRVTSHNLNLNRDYAKAEAPEMQAMLRLLGEWDPILYADLHATDGAQFEHDIAILVEPKYVGSPLLHPAGRQLLREINEYLSARGALPTDFYPSLRNPGDPASGFEHGTYPPRYSTGYWALRNRFVVLVETHSWKDYPTRVRLTRDAILAMVELAARDGRAWLDLAARADAQAMKLGGQTVALDFRTTDRHVMIDFKGYAYTHELSEISGALALRYDPSKPQIWRIPLYDEVVPSLEIQAPKGGYVVPPAYAPLIGGKLRLHDIEYRTLDTRLEDHPVEIFRATGTEFRAQPYEGRMTVRLQGEWTADKQSLPAGSLFVPIAQARSRLVMALLEPRAPDSYAAWGYFNAHFERKEYMEDYVAEQVAREMLARDPDLAAEFKRRLTTDREFAASPRARLEFFYRRHPSWDERFNVYPVVRLQETP